jgi:hypothetical protein
MARLLVVTDSQWRRTVTIADRSAVLAFQRPERLLQFIEIRKKIEGRSFLFRRYYPSLSYRGIRPIVSASSSPFVLDTAPAGRGA